MHLTKNELKSLIKEALSTRLNEATADPLGGGLLGAGAAAATAESANVIQNLFLTAFGLAPQQTAPATPQQGQAGGSWVGKSWRDVMGALKSEFNIRGSKGWYKKLPYNHEARVKYREWYKSRGK